MAERLCGPLEGKRVSVLGLAFKPGTDDVRESVAVELAHGLMKLGAKVSVYDHVAMENAKRSLGSDVQYAHSSKECLRNAECAFIATGWDEFKSLRPSDFKQLMANPVVVDGRRIFDQAKFAKSGVRISTIGTGSI